MQFYRRIKYSRFGWHGNYTSWQEAGKQCTGYNAANILEKVTAAMLKVKNGEAAYEKDSLLFDKIDYSWPLLANLLSIALQQQQQLSLIDFGGSLGSTYFQNRYYLTALRDIKWSVVEQAGFVTTGQQQVGDNQLQFFYTIDEALAKRGDHQVLLLSCVLPYLEKPYEFLKEAIAKRFPYIIIDNTYFNSTSGDRLTVQKVPPAFYDASYPAWFLDYDKVTSVFKDTYELATEYTNDHSLYLDGKKVTYKGFVMKAISNIPTL